MFTVSQDSEGFWNIKDEYGRQVFGCGLKENAEMVAAILTSDDLGIIHAK